jgi:hypothetical protein
MGLSLHAYDSASIAIKHDEEKREVNYTELPLSKSGIIILLIVWQLGMYHISARKKSQLV